MLAAKDADHWQRGFRTNGRSLLPKLSLGLDFPASWLHAKMAGIGRGASALTIADHLGKPVEFETFYSFFAALI